MRASVFALALMLATAVLVLVAGGCLAHREFEKRRPVDRGALQEFGAALQLELAALEETYARDLAEVAASVQRGDAVAIQTLCATVSGIRQCVLAPLTRDGRPQAVPIATATGDRAPDVSPFWPDQHRPPPGTFALDLGSVAAAPNRGGAPAGWLQSGNPAFAAFWLRRSPEEVVALVVDWREVAPHANEHLAAWIEAPYAPLRASGDLISVEGPAAALLAGLNRPPARPADFLLPLRNRLGLWQVLAWDRTEPGTAYDVRTLAVSATVAGVLAVLGVILFRQQRHALRLAEERVSFANRVSHELGTPLTNMLLNLDLAQDNLDDRPKEARHRLELVTDEAFRLARLVSNVLTFSRGERGTLKVKPAPCVPEDVLDRVLRQFGPALARRGVEVRRTGGVSERLLLDADALAQIVANLVSNVEKYAAEGKRLDIESHHADGWLVVRVADNGPGIPAEARERIFEPFERVSSRVNEGATGSGLGLAIARDLARLLGGSLRLLPSERGALFELRVQAMPIAQPAMVTTP